MYSAQLIINGETIDVIKLPNNKLDELVKYFTSLKQVDDEGYPLCPIYKEKVLPTEFNLCSLCDKHSATETYFDHDAQTTKWLNLAQLDALDRANDAKLSKK